MRTKHAGELKGLWQEEDSLVDKKIMQKSQDTVFTQNSSPVSYTESFKMGTNTRKVFKISTQYLWSRTLKPWLPTPQSYTFASGPLTLASVSSQLRKSHLKPGAMLKKAVKHLESVSQTMLWTDFEMSVHASLGCQCFAQEVAALANCKEIKILLILIIPLI